MRASILKAAFILLPFVASAQKKQTTTKQATPVVNESNYYKPLIWRNIGPMRGGRSVTSTGVIGQPYTYYMGTAGGGL